MKNSTQLPVLFHNPNDVAPKTTPQKRKIILFFVVSLLLTVVQLTVNAQTIRYVKMGATGDGSSWAAASGNLTLQAMINASSPGDQVWVAGGTYQPAAGSSFSMKQGVKIYGGFSGSEATLSQRNLSIAANKSVLQGNGASVIVNDNNGLTNASALDGFTITGGTGSPVLIGPGTFSSGGGMLLQGALQL